MKHLSVSSMHCLYTLAGVMWHAFNVSLSDCFQWKSLFSHSSLLQGMFNNTGWSISSIRPPGFKYTSESVLKFVTKDYSTDSKLVILLMNSDSVIDGATLIWRLEGTWSSDLWTQTIKKKKINICNTNLDQMRKLNPYHINLAFNPFSNSISNGPWHIFSVNDYLWYCIMGLLLFSVGTKGVMQWHYLPVSV